MTRQQQLIHAFEHADHLDHAFGSTASSQRAAQRQKKWDLRHLSVAKKIATWSKDPSTQVAALVVTPDNRPVSWGFNGFPMGVADAPERYADRELKYKLIVHAEMNALTFAEGRARGAVLYTWPFPPCARCAGIIIQHGLFRVVAPVLPAELQSRWGEEIALARQILAEAGIHYHLYPPGDTEGL